MRAHQVARALSETQRSLKNRCCAAQYGFHTSRDALTMFIATVMAARTSLHTYQGAQNRYDDCQAAAFMVVQAWCIAEGSSAADYPAAIK